MVEAEAVVII